jgi:hypothetical protein
MVLTWEKKESLRTLKGIIKIDDHRKTLKKLVYLPTLFTPHEVQLTMNHFDFHCSVSQLRWNFIYFLSQYPMVESQIRYVLFKSQTLVYLTHGRP